MTPETEAHLRVLLYACRRTDSDPDVAPAIRSCAAELGDEIEAELRPKVVDFGPRP